MLVTQSVAWITVTPWTGPPPPLSWNSSKLAKLGYLSRIFTAKDETQGSPLRPEDCVGTRSSALVTPWLSFSMEFPGNFAKYKSLGINNEIAEYAAVSSETQALSDVWVNAYGGVRV